MREPRFARCRRSLIRLGALLLLSGLVDPAIGQAPPGEPAAPTELISGTVAEVIVRGNETVSLQRILPHVKTRAERPFDPTLLEDDVRRLHKTRMFVNVNTLTELRADGGVIVIFEVLEHPTIHYVKYIGPTKKLFARDMQKILSKETGLKAGDSSDPYAVEEGRRKIESYYRSKGHNKVRVTIFEGDRPQDRGVVYVIHEGPKERIRWVTFVGNTIVSGQRLKTQIQSKPGPLWLFKGTVDRQKIDDDVLRLTDYYRSLGFFRAVVGRELEFNEEGDWLTLRFSINEGPRYTVDKVAFSGNVRFDSERLGQDLKLTEGKFYDRRAIEADLKTIRDVYGELGYIFTDVRPDPRLHEEPGKLDLVYNVEEGARYRVGRIEVNILGDDVHTQRAAVLNRISLRPNDIVDIREVRNSERRLKSSGLFLSDPIKGIQPTIALDPSNIRASDTAIVERPTPPDEFRGQSPDYEPGDRFVVLQVRGQSPDDYQPFGGTRQPPADPSPWEEYPNGRRGSAQRGWGGPPPSGGTNVAGGQPSGSAPGFAAPQNPAGGAGANGVPATTTSNAGPGELPSLDGYGAPGELFPDGGAELIEQDPIQVIDPVVNVYETETGRFMLGAAFNSEAGLVGSIVLDEQNFDPFRFPTSFRDVFFGNAFRGGGKGLRIEAAPGVQVQRYSFMYRDPYVFNTMYNFGLSGHYYTRRFRDWDEQRLGTSIRTGYQLTPDLTANLALGVDFITLDDPAIPTPPELAEALGDNEAYSAQFDLIYDVRDSAFLATEGHRIGLGFEQTFGSFDYPRVTLDASKYFPIAERVDGSGRHVLSFNGRMGISGTHTPIYDNFFAGGYSTIRGFDFRGASPRNMGVDVGGRFQLLGTAQYMFPLTANDALRGVFFVDAGTVETDIRLNADSFRVAPGFGLRITVPALGAAPIALDLAFPVAHADGDDIENFSIFIGLTK